MKNCQVLIDNFISKIFTNNQIKNLNHKYINDELTDNFDYIIMIINSKETNILDETKLYNIIKSIETYINKKDFKRPYLIYDFVNSPKPVPKKGLLGVLLQEVDNIGEVFDKHLIKIDDKYNLSEIYLKLLFTSVIHINDIIIYTLRDFDNDSMPSILVKLIIDNLKSSISEYLLIKN